MFYKLQSEGFKIASVLLDINDNRARQELRDFINVGLRDVQQGARTDCDEAFDRLEERYQRREVAV